MPRIAFVFAPYNHKRFSENILVVDKDFGVFPPINLAYAAAIAEAAGHEVILLDANALKLDIQATIAALAEFGPRYVGFYFSTYMFHDTLEYAQAIRRALDVRILAGGINLSLYPQESMTHSAIDYGINGEALNSLPRLLAALERGASPEGIPGVCYRENGRIIVNEPEPEADFDTYPFPARHLLPNELYYSITSQRRNFTIMLTTKGCPYKCSFCAIAKIPYRARSIPNVMAEILECYERYGVREIDFFDADFPLNRRRISELCQALIGHNLDLEWSCRSRIDAVDAELLGLMARAGCRKIYYGIETSSADHLRLMNKTVDAREVAAALKATRQAGIKALGFFMTGVPGETPESLLRTIAYATSLDLDYAQFSRTIAKPCTDLDSELINRSGKDFWRDYVLGSSGDARLPNPWTNMSAGSIETFTKLAYYWFYYRPSYVLRALMRIRSWEEFWRGARTALRMLLYSQYSDTKRRRE